MNNKYDANGFADLVNAISKENQISIVRQKMSKYGGSPEQFKKFIWLEFMPFDELKIDQSFNQPSIDTIKSEITKVLN